MRPPSMGFFSLCLFRLFNGKSKVFHYSVPSLECAIAPSIHRGYRPNCIPERTRRRIERRGKKIEFSLLFLLFFSSPLSRILQSGMQSTYCFSFGFAFGPFPCQLLGFLPPSDSCPGATFYPNEIGCTSIYNWPCIVSSSFLPFFWVGVPL